MRIFAFRLLLGSALVSAIACGDSGGTGATGSGGDGTSSTTDASTTTSSAGGGSTAGTGGSTTAGTGGGGGGTTAGTGGGFTGGCADLVGSCYVPANGNCSDYGVGAPGTQADCTNAGFVWSAQSCVDRSDANVGAGCKGTVPYCGIAWYGVQNMAGYPGFQATCENSGQTWIVL